MRDAAAAVARSAALALALAAFTAVAVPLPAARPAEPAAADMPLPVPRPEKAGPPMPAGPIPPPAASRLPMLPEPDLACGPLLAGGKAVARASPPVWGPDGCGIASPVTLDAVVLRDGRRVPLVPPALMRCDLAEAVADWLRDDVVPATAAEGDLLGIADAGGYACRPRNAVAGESLSEHGRGNAVDLVAFRFARRVVGLREADARGTIAALKASACARFATVLGPGSDPEHETHLHLDLARRRNGFKLCQWDLP